MLRSPFPVSTSLVADAEDLLAWATHAHRDRVALSVSFGGGGIVLAHLATRVAPSIPVVFLDTGMHFPETIAQRERFARDLDLNVIDVRPDRDPGALYATDPDACCDIRKVQPMRRTLSQFDAWISAVRRDQSSTRAHLQPVETHSADGRALTRVHPLASWTRADIWAYIIAHELPYHPLHDQGYASIGCWPCTQPAREGEHERAGRWRGRAKTECGLHTFSRRAGESV